MNSIIFITLVLSAYESSLKNDQQWIGYKEKHNKNYQNQIEEVKRFNIFKANDEKIRIHNEKFYKGEEGYLMGHNQFSDMTFEEFSTIYLSESMIDDNLTPYPIYLRQNLSGIKAPEELSYQKYCLPPLNQGGCGSCWAFAASAQVEAMIKMKNSNFNEYLSPQYILDCSRAGSCQGGWPYQALQFMTKNGLVTEKNYQYVGYDQTCISSVQKLDMKPSASFSNNINGNEESLKDYLAKFGPVVVLITATDKFQHYSGHVFWDAACPSNCVGTNHAVLLVGYGSENVNGQILSHWIIKNSWGTQWGESGYVKMIRNWSGLPNNCNVACFISYATV